MNWGWLKDLFHICDFEAIESGVRVVTSWYPDKPHEKITRSVIVKVEGCKCGAKRAWKIDSRRYSSMPVEYAEGLLSNHI